MLRDGRCITLINTTAAAVHSTHLKNSQPLTMRSCMLPQNALKRACKLQ
jgi:hypothetical protein